jgi:hypothetical protein
MRTTSGEINMTGTIHEPCTIIMGPTFTEEHLMKRVRGEYREMPGMRLTVDQAMRLFVLDRKTCANVLSSLVAAHFLTLDGSGRYMMAHGGY